MKQSYLIIANGEPLAQKDTCALAQDTFIVALDGALQTVLDYGLVPDVAIGDFDSIDPVLLENDVIKFIHDDCQNSTDLEKALNYLFNLGAENVTVCHATGWRMDHTLFNLRLLKRFYGKFQCLEIVTELERISFVCDKTLQFSCDKKQPVAILGFPRAVVTSSGLEYDMDGLVLELGKQESTSNHIVASNATISVDGDALLILTRAN